MFRRRGRNRERRRSAAIALTALVAFSQSGCVERRYTIRSDPPGALVVVNNEEVGRTPVSKSFVFYQQRDITLMMDGYQTKKIVQPIDAPWYDNRLTEVVTENFLPFTIRDEREFNYKLEPVTTVPRDELLGRADTLRIEAQTAPKPRRGGILGFFGF